MQRIAAQIVRLAEDQDLYARLSHGALESVSSGALSMPRRRAELAEVYAAAAG